MDVCTRIFSGQYGAKRDVVNRSCIKTCSTHKTKDANVENQYLLYSFGDWRVI